LALDKAATNCESKSQVNQPKCIEKTDFVTYTT
jgi:hypothetical protein